MNDLLKRLNAKIEQGYDNSYVTFGKASDEYTAGKCYQCESPLLFVDRDLDVDGEGHQVNRYTFECALCGTDDVEEREVKPDVLEAVVVAAVEMGFDPYRCSLCEGKGTIQVFDRTTYDFGDHYKHLPCQSCRGTGTK